MQQGRRDGYGTGFVRFPSRTPKPFTVGLNVSSASTSAAAHLVSKNEEKREEERGREEEKRKKKGRRRRERNVFPYVQSQKISRGLRPRTPTVGGFAPPAPPSRGESPLEGGFRGTCGAPYRGVCPRRPPVPPQKHPNRQSAAKSARQQASWSASRQIGLPVGRLACQQLACQQAGWPGRWPACRQVGMPAGRLACQRAGWPASWQAGLQTGRLACQQAGQPVTSEAVSVGIECFPKKKCLNFS